MSKSMISLKLMLVVALFAGPLALNLKANTPTEIVLEETPPTISSQLLKTILTTACDEWPVAHNYSYGTMRSAYNRGTLEVVPTYHPGGDAYLVTYDGITVCVIIPI